MADVVESVRTYLLANATVAGLIVDRIYPDIVEQDATLPAVAVSKISTTHDHTLSNLAGLAHVRLSFDCYADTRGIANQVAEAIRASGLVAVRGITSGTNIRGVRIEEGQRNEIEYSNEASDDHRYVTSMDIMVDYTETI
jgi:hypothetical protein